MVFPTHAQLRGALGEVDELLVAVQRQERVLVVRELQRDASAKGRRDVSAADAATQVAQRRSVLNDVGGDPLYAEGQATEARLGGVVGVSGAVKPVELGEDETQRAADLQVILHLVAVGYFEGVGLPPEGAKHVTFGVGAHEGSVVAVASAHATPSQPESALLANISEDGTQVVLSEIVGALTPVDEHRSVVHTRQAGGVHAYGGGIVR